MRWCLRRCATPMKDGSQMGVGSCSRNCFSSNRTSLYSQFSLFWILFRKAEVKWTTSSSAVIVRFASVDGTDIHAYEPSPFDTQMLSHKFKSARLLLRSGRMYQTRNYRLVERSVQVRREAWSYNLVDNEWRKILTMVSWLLRMVATMTRPA